MARVPSLSATTWVAVAAGGIAAVWLWRRLRGAAPKAAAAEPCDLSRAHKVDPAAVGAPDGAGAAAMLAALLPFVRGEADNYFNGLVPASAPKPGWRVVDAGAHVGSFSLEVMRRCRGQASILAFEPVPHIFRACRDHLRVADPSETSIRVFNCGLSDRDGVVTFNVQVAPSTSMLSSYKSQQRDELTETFTTQAMVDATLDPDAAEHFRNVLPAGRLMRMLPRRAVVAFLDLLGVAPSASLSKAREQELPVRRISSVLREEGWTSGPIDLIKIDVEGAEHDVLLGIDEEDWPRIQRVVLEVNNSPRYRLLEPICALLHKHGLTETHTEIEAAFKHVPGGVHMVYAQRPGL